MRVIYMAHPVRGDVEGNLARARGWIRAIEERCPDVAVVASWITECEIWDDANEDERAAGLRRDMAVIAKCDELWMVGEVISAGMTEERTHAKALGIPVRWVANEEQINLARDLCAAEATAERRAL